MRHATIVALLAILIQVPTAGAQQAPALSPQDYIDIQQLVSKYA